MTVLDTKGTMLQELVDALKAAGAQQISFNPFTEAVLTRRLLAIADTEGMPLAKAQAESLAMRAAGNMSAAINSLQLSTRSRSKAAISHANVSKTGKKVRQKPAATSNDESGTKLIQDEQTAHDSQFDCLDTSHAVTNLGSGS